MNAFIRFGTALTRCAGDCDRYVPDYEAVVVDGVTYCEDCGTHVEAEAFALAVDALREAMTQELPFNLDQGFDALFRTQ